MAITYCGSWRHLRIWGPNGIVGSRAARRLHSGGRYCQPAAGMSRLCARDRDRGIGLAAPPLRTRTVRTGRVYAVREVR